MRITNAQASSRQLLVWLALLIFSLFALSGCAPRFVGEGAVPPTGEAIAIDLPALVIDVNPDGQLSAAGLPLADLGAALGQDLSTLSLPASLVAGLQAANIQHLQLVNSADGLSVLANGREIPAISWASGALDTTGNLLSELGVLEPEVAQLLQLLEQANVGATLRLPLAEGATELPLVDAEPSQAAAEAQETQLRFINSVRNNLPAINFTINYDSTGQASLEGISPALLNLLGVSLDALNQDPAVIQQLKDAGVGTIDLTTGVDGAFASINEQALPYIDWSDGKMITLVELLEEAGLLDAVSDNPDARTAILGLIKQVLPVIQAADVNLQVNIE